jgi:hypothetical protein
VKPLSLRVIACDKREAFAHGSEATKQSTYPLCRTVDCFASLAIKKRPGLLPALRLFASLVTGEAYFASARFGGVAGHDFTSVS